MESGKNGAPNLGLGIDTGGTYTDAAILSMDTGAVLSKAKALTTRHDLAEGIGNAINNLDHSMYPNIRLLAVSSTLATNSVVEGKGCRVGLIVIGHEAVPNIPVDEILQIKGGHNLQGEKREELDTAAAQEAEQDVEQYLVVQSPGYD
jgi:N-methylhydantoinase A/oxoprolinase/acetone carboxylase beta subunit